MQESMNMAFDHDAVDAAGDSRQQNSSNKRRRLQAAAGDDYQNHNATSRERYFLPLAPNPYIFHCDQCTTGRSFVYTPLQEETMINVRKFDQITFSQAGQHFTADSCGEYTGNRRGHVVNFWRYDKSTRASYISFSLLIIDIHVFNAVKDYIEHI